MNITIPDGISENEAAKLAREAVRKAKAAEKAIQAKRELASIHAYRNWHNVVDFYFRKTVPHWELIDVSEGTGSFSMQDNGYYRLLGAKGDAEFHPPHMHELSFVVEGALGVVAIGLVDRYDDRFRWSTVGFHEGEMFTLSLPDDVGAWLQTEIARQNAQS